MSHHVLTDGQRALREASRKFAQRVLAPAAMETDQQGLEFPSEILGVMAQNGFVGIDIPEEYGGQGLDILTCAVVLEELAAGWFSSTIYSMNLATDPIVARGTEEQKRRYLPEICAGRALPCFCLTEPEAGSDAASITTSARRDGSDYVLRGRKIYITNAHRADVLVVFARTGLREERGGGISIFLVDRGTPGLSIGQKFATIAHTANPIWEVLFDDCRIPSSSLLGEEGDGFSYMQSEFGKTRAVYGARCVGVAQAALDYALRYASQRQQFGKPISQFQGIRFAVAEMVAQIEAARQLSYRAAVLAQEGAAEAPVAAAMAKLVASALAVQTTGQAMQLMGGHGLIKDHPVERYYREAKLFQIGDGTSEVLRLLISRAANDRIRDGQSARLGG